MTDLVNAYQRKEIREFEKILKDNRATIMDDPFIRTYIDDVLKNIRTQVLVQLIKPYTRIQIKFISKVRVFCSCVCVCVCVCVFFLVELWVLELY